MVPVCPVRSEASHRSEQVSQLLFGEMCELLETAKDFVRIRVLYDNYEGWCQLSQLEETEDAFFSADKILAGEWVNKIAIDDQLMHVPFGSSLGFLQNESGITKKYNIRHDCAIIKPGADTINIELVKNLAYTFLNTPYQWGGRSVFGIDCSGFTQLVCQCMDVFLMRDAYQQATQGEEVDSLKKIQCGDLAFFNNEAGRITHTGILFDSDTIIHASGKVRIDSIDDLGIINRKTGKRTHDLRVIKRVIPTKIG
jgi:hypothetical protein